MPAINEEKVKNHLEEILKNIQSEADPNLLNQYRSLIRKNVSFFQRSYLAAYLLLLQDQGANRSRDQQRGASRKSGGNEAPRGKPAPQGSDNGEEAEQSRQRPAQPVALPEDESTRLFISVGRNRRVFPREILGLIGSKTTVPKEDIGTINILNNYSFVQVRNAAADEIIEALNGINFRGRTLAVNYAKARKEEDEDPGTEPSEKPLEDFSESDAIDTEAYTGYDDTPAEDSEPGPDHDGSLDADGDADAEEPSAE
jgi:hypothetical protein